MNAVSRMSAHDATMTVTLATLESPHDMLRAIGIAAFTYSVSGVFGYLAFLDATQVTSDIARPSVALHNKTALVVCIFLAG